MRKNVVFAFYSRIFPSDSQGHLNLIFHKDGLFRHEDDVATPSRRLCPVDDLDWDVQELSLITYAFPSVLMRFIMHPSIVGEYAPPEYLVSATTDHAAIKDSIVIVHKSLLIAGGIPQLLDLKKRNNILLFDILDFPQERAEPFFPFMDGLILCSHKAYAQYEALSRITVPFFYLTHCIDTRIPLRTGSLDHFSALYHGSQENMLYYPSLPRLLDIAFCYASQTPQKVWLEKTLAANFFYALRPPETTTLAKPFQKGFTAAQLDANILIHRDDGDALYFLGEDYPYMIHEEPTEEVVWRYMKMAEKDFGGPRWHKGLEILRTLRLHYARETIGQEFWDIIGHFS